MTCSFDNVYSSFFVYGGTGHDLQSPVFTSTCKVPRRASALLHDLFNFLLLLFVLLLLLSMRWLKCQAEDRSSVGLVTASFVNPLPIAGALLSV